MNPNDRAMEPCDDGRHDMEEVLLRTGRVNIEGEPMERTADLLNAALDEVRSLQMLESELLPERAS